MIAVDRFPDLVQMPEYQAISGHYRDRTATRSGVRLMDHIDQGVMILGMIGADVSVARAFCLHPIFQMDETLPTLGEAFIRQHGWSNVTMFAMEYRGVANAHLAHHVMSAKGIRLSPYVEVNQMLIADKVQNRKDFERHHLNTHPNAGRLAAYFREWLDALGVSEDQYRKLASIIP